MQNYWDSLKISGCRGLVSEEEGGIGGTQGFLGQWTVLYDVRVDIS